MIKTFIIDDTEAGTRIDLYLSELLEDVSRTKIQNLIKSNYVLINNKTCKPSQIINTDDEVSCDVSDIEQCNLQPENIPLDIVYEDDNIAIINKPSGMLTHPTSKEKNNTLVNALLGRYGNNLSDLNGEYRRGIVHRLDRNTSGLLIIAKNNNAHAKIAEMIKQRSIEKRYLTIVKGVIDNDTIINEPIGRSKSHPNKMMVTPDGKPSLTEVKIIEQLNNATYLDINLKTGRTHQIRVHLAYIGHPVFNDTLYGFGKMKIKTEEQVLQSYKLKFLNPFNDKLIDIEIEPDEKIKKILQYIKNK
ncbi:MAG: RluA family pseudouridine synthase [Candidatus Gastranaerophilales bacterium]|nr:RluA family pseudouridine synthase [Candidatus Gastranaerophilales bacterium]